MANGVPTRDDALAAHDELFAAAPARFDAGTDGTLGVEEEFAIVDPETLDLVPRYEELRAAAIDVGLEPNVAGELISAEIEFRSGPYANYAQACSGVSGLRVRIADLARGAGAGLGASATHPWADYRDQTKISTPYYQDLARRMGWSMDRNNTFGLHVHVGVRGAERAIAVANALREYQPELLALSASSPFLDGYDTRNSSMRAMIFSRNVPRGNVAPVWRDFAHYASYVRWLTEVGSINSPGQIWWGVRPHPTYGTVELRMFDGQPDVADTLALTAVGSGIALHLADLHDAGELPEPLPFELIEENQWRALRHGTDAEFVELPGTRLVPARERLAQIVELARGASTRHDLELDAGLDHALEIVEAGSSAARQRERYVETGDLRTVYREVVDQTSGARTSNSIGA